MVEESRVQLLNDLPTSNGEYVLYWMQASQRTIHNPALELAVERANAMKLPLIVGFGLMDDYPEANARHYAFMLEGLRDVQVALMKRGIRFIVRHGPPPDVAIALAKKAAAVICDRGYLRHQRQWREKLATEARCRVEQVEADVVVPVEAASDKAEFAARTIRPKINRLRDRYLRLLHAGKVRVPSTNLKVKSDIDITNPKAAIAKLKLDWSVKPVTRFVGGQNEAQRRLKHFLRHHLNGYAQGRREPADNATSNLSPYLHFGQISPVEIAIQVRRSHATAKDREAFLEELIVRRELAMNFVQYTSGYDRFSSLPHWARQTLMQHRRDKRYRTYSLAQLEVAQTDDPFWNAAQREMTISGFMPNSLRMYWGKKVLEWTRSPRRAFETLLHLNNKYFLDGRDPVSFANVGWIFGLHDRPWQKRAIFGTVRYMNAAGLERKFDMDAYLKYVGTLEAAESNHLPPRT